MYDVLCRFFFLKQKTAYEMRISDWSSDVCSSDLHVARLVPRPARRHQVLAPILDPLHRRRELRGREHHGHLLAEHEDLLAEAAPGVASDHPDPVLERKSVV